MTFRKQFILQTAILFSICFVGCTDSFDICNSPIEIRCKGNFYNIIGATETPGLIGTLTVNATGNTGFVVNDQNTSIFNLPFTPNADSTKYFFDFGVGLPKDTVTIKYSTSVVSTSAECGTVYSFSIANVKTSTNYLDSIKVVNPSVNSTQANNLKVYF
jgi:hypothetical protein